MSIADETLDNIKRENRLNPDDRVTFLLGEIKYRENDLEYVLGTLKKQMAQLPKNIVSIANNYGIDLND